MLTTVVGKTWRRIGRKSQQGQSILLLAFGFIALAAFIGLVTDISIMFVRYAALRQAVDSAAVAAAGQIREGTNYGTVALSARQYIRLHGLDATRVWVETCETDIAEWRKTNPEPRPLTQMPSTDLCDWSDPRKLVRVRAQIDSQTTFLRLIGIEDFILTASAMSETAALDVALVLDTSLSMARFTDDDDYAAVGQLPLPEGSISTTSIREECERIPTGMRWQGTTNYQYGPCCNDPGSGTALQQNQSTGEWVIYTDSNGNQQMDAGEAGIRNNTADNNFTDLICDPFKQVKDAARNFIKRLDFVRGDRVALVTFDFHGNIIYPNGNTDLPPIMNSETDAVNALNMQVGILENPVGSEGGCKWLLDAGDVAINDLGLTGAMTGYEQEDAMRNSPDGYRYYAYETIAPCNNTNIGDGLLTANNVLTNAETIRRDAVWVAILLTDGAANATGTAQQRLADNWETYGNIGFCPWATFCQPHADRTFQGNTDYIGRQVACNFNAATNQYDLDCLPVDVFTDPYYGFTNPATGQPYTENQVPLYNECVAIQGNAPYGTIPNGELCNDNRPETRHFCLTWSNDPDMNMQAAGPECLVQGNYDADDYARDIADFAGLIEVSPGIAGNFISIFTIGFGDNVATSPTAAPLLRYIADVGDNGVVDNDIARNTREQQYGSSIPSTTDDPCQGITDPEDQCGQYYFANSLQELDEVFESIASRLFTRISR